MSAAGATVYVDTSALGRVLLSEPDASSVREVLRDARTLVSSRLLAIELTRLGMRTDRMAAAERLVAAIVLLPMSEAVLELARTVSPSSVASLDAIHLATALETARTEPLAGVLTFDQRLAEGAAHHGLTALSPGA